MSDMKHREIHVRVNKPSKSCFLLFALLLLTAAALYFRLTGLENELNALRGELQSANEGLRQARAVADAASAGLEELQDRAASMWDRLEEAPSRNLSGPEILAETPVIAHAMGSVNWEAGHYNSLEAFQASYAAGFRAFEVDLALTRDGKAVLKHLWFDYYLSGDIRAIPTLEEFLSTPVQGPAGEPHTPLSFRNLLNLMAQYPDICVIIDTKYTDPEMIFLAFSAMLADAEDLERTDLFDRIILHLNSREMRQYLDTLYPFPHFLYAMYMENIEPDSDRFRDRAAYCAKTGVMLIQMESAWWDSSFASIAEEYGLKVYLGTVSDLDAARAFLDQGVSGVYTDCLTPDNFMDN